MEVVKSMVCAENDPRLILFYSLSCPDYSFPFRSFNVVLQYSSFFSIKD